MTPAKEKAPWERQLHKAQTKNISPPKYHKPLDLARGEGMEMQEQLHLMFRRKRISQKTAADYLRISQKSLSQKMTGKVDFKWKEIVLLCRLLGISNPLDFSQKEAYR